MGHAVHVVINERHEPKLDSLAEVPDPKDPRRLQVMVPGVLYHHTLERVEALIVSGRLRLATAAEVAEHRQDPGAKLRRDKAAAGAERAERKKASRAPPASA